MDVRKNLTDLTAAEVNDLATALNAVFNAGTIENNAILHRDSFNIGIHWGPAFLPWHRDFLRKLELALQAEVPGVTIPYWDWTRGDSRNLDAPWWVDFLGGRANTGGRFDTWIYTRSGASTAGWDLPVIDDVVEELSPDTFLGLRGLEGGSHVPGHVWTGGSMASGTSPRDPLFWFHHCNLDRIWSIWQLNHPDAEQYEHLGVSPRDAVPQARVPLNDPMIGGATPASMLDHVALGYNYQRDPVLEAVWLVRKGSILVTTAPAEAMEPGGMV